MMSTTQQAPTGSPAKVDRGSLRKWIDHPADIKSPGIFHPKLPRVPSKHAQMNDTVDAKQTAEVALVVGPEKFRENEFKKRVSKMSQSNYHT